LIKVKGMLAIVAKGGCDFVQKILSMAGEFQGRVDDAKWIMGEFHHQADVNGKLLGGR
jgi:hypothetical protein